MNSFILATSAFDLAVNKLRQELILIAFLLVVAGIWEGGWKAGGDPKAIFGTLLKTIIIITLIANFPTILTQGKETFDSLRASISTPPQDKFTELLHSNFKKVEPGISTIGPYVASLIVTILQCFGALGPKIVIYFQLYSIGCLKAISPLMIGLLAISYTQNIGIKFLMTSLNVIMWSLGFIFVDLFLNYLGNDILAAMLSAGIGASAAATAALISWPVAIGATLIAALVPTFLYIATPMAIASLMSGANAGAAAAWGGLSNMSQTAQQVTRGGAALEAMKASSSSIAQSGSASNASTGGSIPRPPNPIV